MKPYSKITTVDMWTDEHISKQMLKYHLDGTNDAASRKTETIVKTVDFIETMISKDKKICDYGCGPGLYTDKLQTHGYDVIGIDVSQTSLDYAKKVNPKVGYYNMNYVENKIDQKVDFAMMIYCDFGALPPESQTKVLSNISESLNDDGLFFFDVLSYLHYDETKESSWDRVEMNEFFMKGPYTLKTKIIKYPELKLLLNHQIATGSREFEVFNWDKCYSIEEMKMLLNKNNLDVIDVFSDTKGNKNFNDNRTLAFLCKKNNKNS